MTAYSYYTNNELFGLIQTDNKKAFTELFNRSWLQLLEVAFRLVLDEATAEDVVQDVLSTIWKSRSQLEIVDIDKYLYVAVKYRSLFYIRKAQKVQLCENKEMLETGYQDIITENLNYKYLAEWLEKATNLLPEKCQLIFRYSRDHNMTAKQIAYQLSLSIRTVETQLYKATLHLKRSLKTLNMFTCILFYYFLD
jgi:RNA polymerase sigma-70 factor (family 1)